MRTLSAIWRMMPLLLLCQVPAGGSSDTPLRIGVVAGHGADQILAERVLKLLPGKLPRGFSLAEPVQLNLDDVLERLPAAAGGPDVDMFLVLGSLAAAQVMSAEKSPEKPTIIGAAGDLSLLGVSYNDMGRSGKKNVNFVGLGPRFAADLQLFKGLHNFNLVTVLMEPQLLEEQAVKQRLQRIGADLGVVVTPLPFTDDQQAESIQAGTVEAVYLGPLRHLDESRRAGLFMQLAKQGVPTYAMLGVEDVERGAFAGALSDMEEQLANRLADRLAALARGERAEDLPAWMPVRERLTINGLPAAHLGLELDLQLRIQTDILHPEALARGRKLALKPAIERALAANPQLAASRERVHLADKDRKIVNAALLPQLSLDADHLRNDPDTPQVGAGFSAESQTQFALQARQVLFDQKLLTQSNVAAQRLKASESQLTTNRLETINATVGSYLNLLSRMALLDIEVENLKLTRGHLRTARARLQLGAGGIEEVYRWESQEAR